MNAVLSPCGLFRYSLERSVAAPMLDLEAGGAHECRGKLLGFFGVNPSTADAVTNDATVGKWLGFCMRWGARGFIVGNVFAYRSRDVSMLAGVADPCGPENWGHIQQIVHAADILVPCWGSLNKVPTRLHPAFVRLLDALQASGKPVRCFGQTASGDPKHPQMLGYDTPLVPLRSAACAAG